MLENSHLAKPKDGPAPRWFHVATAASMVISALAALIGTLHTSRTMEALVEQNARLVRANSTPILEFGHGNARDDGSSVLEFNVRNVGTGAARVVWFELRVDGQVMPDMQAALRAVSPGLQSPMRFMSGPVAPRVFASGAEQRIFGWPKPAEAETAAAAAWRAMDSARFKRIKVEACYCSLFDECWKSQLDGGLPTPAPSCPAEKRQSLWG